MIPCIIITAVFCSIGAGLAGHTLGFGKGIRSYHDELARQNGWDGYSERRSGRDRREA